MTAPRSCGALALVLAIASLAHAQTSIAPAGTGSPGDPYLVASLENLVWMSENPDDWDALFEQTADIDARGTAAWNGGEGFVPIGTRDRMFVGTYHGRGHRIVGLAIHRPDTTDQALFGSVGATALLDSIVLSEVDVLGKARSGALVGTLSQGSVLACRSTGRVQAREQTAGGLVGYNDHGRIERCQATVAVSGGYLENGGLVGFSDGEIRASHASGKVDGFEFCGGLVGMSKGHIHSSSATGDVVCIRGVGGLVGENRGVVANSQAEGNVWANPGLGAVRGYAGGGLVGRNYSTISYCRATGRVVADAVAGGLVGANHGPIDHSSASGTVMALHLVAGGLVGENLGDRFVVASPGRELDHGSIRQCYATGAVRAAQSVGGLVGENQTSLVEQCYATGAVSSSLIVAAPVGGLIGSLVEDARVRATTVIASHWDTESTLQTQGCGVCSVSVFGAEGHATSTMRLRTTYAGWDFSQDWSIEDGVEYPVLRAVADIPTAIGERTLRAQSLARGTYPLEVFDLRGRRVWAGEARWSGSRWELPRLGAGTWVVRARMDQGVHDQIVFVMR